MNPTSISLRRKIAVLEGTEVVDEDGPELQPSVIDAARGVPLCCEKVLPVALCWDDVALAGFLEAVLDTQIDRLHCVLDASEESDHIAPGHVKNDTLIVVAQLCCGRVVTIHLRGTHHLLPATEATKKTMHNGFTAATAHFLKKTARQHSVVCITLAKVHSEAALEGAVVQKRKYVHEISFGKGCGEPWNAVRFLYVALQDYGRCCDGVGDGVLAEWCWFFSNYQTATVEKVPERVKQNAGIVKVWGRLAQLGSGDDGTEFQKLWGQTAIVSAVNMQETNADAHAKQSAEAEQAMRDRHQMYKKQVLALDSL